MLVRLEAHGAARVDQVGLPRAAHDECLGRYLEAHGEGKVEAHGILIPRIDAARTRQFPWAERVQLVRPAIAERAPPDNEGKTSCIGKKRVSRGLGS